MPSHSETPGLPRRHARFLIQRLSAGLASGIPKHVQAKDAQSPRLLAMIVIGALAASCTIRGLAHDDLFGSPDAAVADAGSEVTPDTAADVGADLVVFEVADAVAPADVVEPPDVAGDDAVADATADAGPPTDGSVVACTPTSCPSDQFCDDLSQQCLPRAGSGMLSGVAYNMCNRKNVDARVGIAGQRQCTASQKGSYYFHSNLPYGLLTLSAAAEGYKVFSTTVDIVPGGTVQDIPMIPDTPNGCADPSPPAVPCTCTDPACSV